MRGDLLTDSATMLGWISAIAAQGIRRPGYPADAWTETWARDRFVEFGLSDVTLDPVSVDRWEPLACSLEVWRDDAPADRVPLPCFPVPFTAPADGLTAELAVATGGARTDVAPSRARCPRSG